MGRIGQSTFRDWNNGETMYEADYEKDREIIRTAVNDNHDRTVDLQGQVTSNDTDIEDLQGQITSNDTDITNLQNADADLQSQLDTHKSEYLRHNHDGRYMTKNELAPYLQGGDTIVYIETFTITSSNNADGTFTYTDGDGTAYTGLLGDSGEQIFTLQKGRYAGGLNHIKAFINDTLYRSRASGGLLEISETEVAISPPEGANTEVTFEYYQRIGVTGEHNVLVGPDQPPPSEGGMLWLKVVE